MLSRLRSCVLKIPRARTVIISKNTSVNLEMGKSKGPQNEDFISVGSNLVRFGGSFSFLRFGRFKVRFLGPN